MVTHRYLGHVLLLKSLSMDIVGIADDFCVFVMRMTLHLSGINIICQSCSQFSVITSGFKYQDI